jgi:hypothetical protein
VTGAPAFPYGGESPLPGGWMPVVPSAIAAASALLCALPEARRPVLAGGALLGGVGMLGYCLLAWIDVVMVLMVPFGLPMSGGEAGAMIVRVAGAAGGALAVAVGVVELRRIGVRIPPLVRTPVWGWAAALLAVAGLAARLVPEVPQWAERGISGPGGVGFLVFVGLMLLAGTALPAALVVPWGRRLPRWLLLGPAPFVGCGLLAYFGIGGFGAMATGRTPADLAAVLMIGGYTVWGVGLLVAALSYAATTGRDRAQPAR